jgi:hypothetical protein
MRKELSKFAAEIDKAEIFREAMKIFVRIQAAKRLAALGGTMPEMTDIPRERDQTEPSALLVDISVWVDHFNES